MRSIALLAVGIGACAALRAPPPPPHGGALLWVDPPEALLLSLEVGTLSAPLRVGSRFGGRLILEWSITAPGGPEIIGPPLGAVLVLDDQATLHLSVPVSGWEADSTTLAGTLTRAGMPAPPLAFRMDLPVRTPPAPEASP